MGPLRRQRGRIINVSSGAANHPIAMASAYCAAKAGLNHFTRVVAEEEPSLTVVAVRPGVVDTAIVPDGFRAPEFNVMPPEEMAEQVVDLLREVCRWRQVVGFDVVELMPNDNNRAPDFLAARLAYQIMAYMTAFAEE